MSIRLHATLRRGARAALLSALFLALGAPACWAQLGGPGLTGNGGGVGPVVNPADGQASGQSAPNRAQAPALPGAKSDPNLVAPITKLPSEMNPTDALFDAINRGDITVARDAINRGADLSARNVLGMTPMELSVDLSRNDISFLLLSMRGADTGPRGPAQTAAGTKGAKPEKLMHEVRAKMAQTVKVTAPPPPRVARLFTGDGGTPVPQSGFLGFDTTGRN
jgi:hypothetical protein